MDRMQVASTIGNILKEAGVHESAVQHIWDRLVDGLTNDSEQELAILYAMLQPSDSNFIFIKDGKITSPKEPGAVAYRMV